MCLIAVPLCLLLWEEKVLLMATDRKYHTLQSSVKKRFIKGERE